MREAGEINSYMLTKPARARVWGRLETERALDSPGQDDEGMKLNKRTLCSAEDYMARMTSDWLALTVQSGHRPRVLR